MSFLGTPFTTASTTVSPLALLLRSMNSRACTSESTFRLNASGTQVWSRSRAYPCMVPMNSSASPVISGNAAVVSSVTRSFSSAAAFSVNVNATMSFGSTPGSRRISTIRSEITWVFPDPAHATISSGSSSVPIAARCAPVYSTGQTSYTWSTSSP